ncbi:MAG: tyrosine--tRNA ligase [Candidatus Omnitrophota bacterium]|nr:tyrosine--tRNA ligase [Candidatus Omnitrophota bacterium]
MQKRNINQQLEIIKRGATEIISEEELIQKLKESIDENRPLRIKAGFDPTAPDIHLGHTVLLKKLRQFQDLGHRIYFLIGDFTGTIGDPSGQDKIRKRLTEEEVNKNALTYKKQVFKILDPKKTEVVFNSAWFKKMASSEILNLASYATVAQILARQDFNQRYTQGRDISLLEIFYPLLQAYDSVHLKADVEIGGGDQKFNLLLGRELQRDFKQKPQVIIMLPLLEGTDGVAKMSKSYGNYIGINEAPNEMFGKIMSISDELMFKYYELLTDEDLTTIKNMHPKEAKLKLAKIVVAQYHSQEQAVRSEKEFQGVFSAKELPQDMPIYKLDKDTPIIEILQNAGMVKSGNEARRLIRGKAVIFNNKNIEKENFFIKEAGILKVGPRKFLKIVK